jgi:hypothetical protein
MSLSFKRLGQVKPSASTETSLYIVPAGTQTVLSRLSIANTSSSASARVTVYITAGGASASADTVLASSFIPANGTISVCGGFALGAGYEVRVLATTANIAFNAFGEEVTT